MPENAGLNISRVVQIPQSKLPQWFGAVEHNEKTTKSSGTNISRPI